MPNAPCPFSSSAPDRIRRVGEVLATNTRTGKTSPEAVSAVSVRHDTDLYDLKVKSGGRVAVIHTTSNHPFWDPQSRKWVQAGKLRVGEPLRTADGGSAPARHDGLMWDLTVPGNNDHDFYVTTVPGGRPATHGTRQVQSTYAAVLVHNCPSEPSSVDPRDVHGSLRDATRTSGDEVWNSPDSEMFVQNDGQIVKVLETKKGVYSVAIRDMSNPSGGYTTVMQNFTKAEFERKIESGAWE